MAIIRHSFRAPRKTTGDIQAVVMIVIFILGLLSWFALRVMQVSSGHNVAFNAAESQKKLCYANMRILLGACELYNMDNTKMIHTIKETDYTSQSGRLIKNKYLKKPLHLPSSKCRYYSEGDLSKNGIICCVKHGSVEPTLSYKTKTKPTDK